MAGLEGLVKSAFGTKVYICEADASPTSTDLVVGLKGISGGPGFSLDTVDATELDNDGYSKMVPTTKKLNPITLTINRRDDTTFEKFLTWSKMAPSNDDYFKKLVIVYPESAQFTNKGFEQLVFLSGWSMGDATTSSVLDYTVELTGQDGIEAFTGTIE